MTDNAPKRPRRRRWRFVLIVFALLALIGALALRHYSRPDNITALLVEQARSQLGAELSLDGAANYAFSPGLQARLPHPLLKMRDTVVLRADALNAIVPWRSLWSQRVEIQRVELIRPVLDLDALRAWIAERPPSTTAPPDVRFSLHVEHGSLVSGGNIIADDFSLDLANDADIAAWLAQFDPRIANRPLLAPVSGSAAAASVQIGSTRLEGVHVEVKDEPAAAPASR
jgi:hypothetical protein